MCIRDSPKKGAFMFVATSWPENAQAFYAPIVRWIEEYFNNTPLPETVFKFNFNYINTASAKQLAKILTILKEYSSENNIKIQWFYEKDDFDMEKEGRKFSAILEMDFEYVEK